MRGCGVYALAGLGGGLYYPVARTPVYLQEVVNLFRHLASVQVHLVEDNDWGHVVYLAGHQYPVQELHLDLREIQRHRNHGQVQVGPYYVRLAAQIGGASDHVVAAGEDLGDYGRILLVGLAFKGVSHLVPDCHGVGSGEALKPDFAAQDGGK